MCVVRLLQKSLTTYFVCMIWSISSLVYWSARVGVSGIILIQMLTIAKVNEIGKLIRKIAERSLKRLKSSKFM